MRISDWSSDVCSSDLLAQQGDGWGEVRVRITDQIGQAILHQLRHHVLVAFERYSLKCPDTDMTMTEAYQDRGSGGRRLITARQFLAGLDQREGLAGVDRKSTRLNSSH